MLSPAWIGKILFVIVSAYVLKCALFAKNLRRTFELATWEAFAFFLLLPGMHERYLIYAIPFACVWMVLDMRKAWPWSLVVTAVCAMNISMINGFKGADLWTYVSGLAILCFVAGVVNVRDIGGYESTLVEGGRIRQGVFYRGAKLNSIKKKGKPQLHEELGVGLEIDLRDEQQCTGPYVDGVEYFPVSIPSGTEEERFTEFAEEYQKIYGKIAETDQVIYLHCSAGADRTGLVTFMLLALCGVQYEDIARDYMFTNFADQGKREIDALDEWWEQLGALEGETVADKAASWMLSKGVTPEQIELIRTKLVEGYGE